MLKQFYVLDWQDKDLPKDIYAAISQYGIDNEWGNDSYHGFDIGTKWEADEDRTPASLAIAKFVRPLVPEGTEEILINFWW